MVFGSRASRFVSLCLAACVVLLLGLGMGCAGRVEVPDVGGYPLAEATTLIEEAGLAVGEVEYAQHKGRAANEVIRSEPEAGTRVSPGDLIDLVVVANGVGVMERSGNVVSQQISTAQSVETATFTVGLWCACPPETEAQMKMFPVLSEAPGIAHAALDIVTLQLEVSYDPALVDQETIATILATTYDVR